MIIEMLRTQRGADEIQGITQVTKTYLAGERYEVCDQLARLFLEIGAAKAFYCEANNELAEKEIEMPKKKRMKGSPENKALA